MAKKFTDKELREIGQMVVDIHQLGYVSKGQMMFYSFLKGLATGFGIFLGGTVLIALLLWILGFFENVPLLQDFIDSIQETIESSSTTSKF